MAVNVCFRKSTKLSLNKKSIFTCEFGYSIQKMIFVLSFVILSFHLGTGIAADSEISCASVKNIFESKGMLSAVDIQDHLSSDGGGLCAGVRGCCGAGARAGLTAQARAQLEASLRAELAKLSEVLANRAHRFDEFFKKLLQQSKEEFHQMFKRTYGMIYEQHSYVFTELFEQLERYYSHGDVDLLQLMDKFFNVLYQKMFTVLNSQYSFDDKYLKCVSEHMRDIQPFDDVPHKLSIQLRRAFVATRTFQRALQAGAERASGMAQVGVSEECAAAWARLRWCGACAGAAPPACSRYCHNVLRGCLPLHADLAHHWDAYVDAVDKVSDRLLGPFNIVMVVEPIDIKISEAIMNFQEHNQEISQKIFAGCGKPVLGASGGAAGPFFAPKRGRRSAPQRFGVAWNDDLSDDFEIEASDESAVLRSARSDEDSVEDLVEKAEMRETFLQYMRGQIDSEELGERRRRDADPAPAARPASKEIDFELYEFEGARGRRKGGKKPGSSKKTESDWSSGGGGGAGAGGAALERLVRESRARVRNSRRYWAHLPYLLCSDDAVAAPPARDSCFNGTHVASYTGASAGEGSAALATNPEVQGAGGAGGGAGVLAAQQEALRVLTAKLKDAYNGMEVQWSDYGEPSRHTPTSHISRSDDDSAGSLIYGSGSGSGDREDDFTDDDEDRRPNYSEEEFTNYPASGHGPTEDDETETPALPEEPSVPYKPVVVPGVDAPPPVPKSEPEPAPPAPTLPAPAEPPAPVPPVREQPATAGARMSLPRALLTYSLPIACAWLGGIVNDLL